MAQRRYEEVYDRDQRDRRGRDPRDVQRDPDPRERLDARDHRRIVGRDQDSMDYTRDNYPDIRSTRDPAPRPVYAYTDQNDRDELPSRGGYLDDSRDRHNRPPPIDLQGRREEPSSRYQEYFLPSEDINREVIQYDICRYLGNDATVRPYNHPDGRQGFLIKAYRAPTTAMIATLKADSKRFEVEQAQRRRQFGQAGMSFGASATFDDRQRQGRPDAPQSGYAGYGMDTSMDDYDDDRVRGYRDQELRMDPRLDSRTDPRQDSRPDPRQGDPRQQVPSNRHNQMPSVSQGYSQDPSYATGYQVQSVSGLYDPTSTASQPRTLGPNNTPPPPMGRAGQAIFQQGFPVTTSTGYSIPTSAPLGGAARYAEPTNGRPMVGYPGGLPYGPDRHAASRR